MTGAALRRCIHASFAIVPLIAPIVSWHMVRVILALGIPLVLGLEVGRLALPALGAWLARVVPVFRPREAKHVSGAAWLWLGFAIAAWLPPMAAAGGMLVGALADPAASLIGSRWGAGKPKSLAGTAAAIIVAAIVLRLGHVPWVPAVLGAFAAGALERWSGPLDDNVLLAPGVGLVVMMMVG